MMALKDDDHVISIEDSSVETAKIDDRAASSAFQQSCSCKSTLVVEKSSLNSLEMIALSEDSHVIAI
jgi:hypothetical protein